MERVTKFDPMKATKLFRPDGETGKEETKNGQVTVIGGSELFHGAPLLSLKVSSKIVDMVFFSSPDSSIGEVAANLKSKLLSFIWVPWEEVGSYIKKSDAILIGPGFMRYRKEAEPSNDEATEFTKRVTSYFLAEYPDKKWVIDAGSLQVLEKDFIPAGAILTPNQKEYEYLFGDMDPADASREFKCTIILKGVTDKICTDGECVEVFGGNIGMSKGGTGDTLAGLTVALFAKNGANVAATWASYITKMAGDELFKTYGPYYNADQLADKVPEVLNSIQIKQK